MYKHSQKDLLDRLSGRKADRKALIEAIFGAVLMVTFFYIVLLMAAAYI